jgi:hypothetical protein
MEINSPILCPADDMPTQIIVKTNYFENIIHGIIINAISYSIDDSIYL